MFKVVSTFLPGAKSHSLQRYDGRLLRRDAILHHKKPEHSWQGQAKPCDSDGRQYPVRPSRCIVGAVTDVRSGTFATIMKIIAMGSISNVADMTHSWSEITIWYL